ncbi:hypothetical protein [Luteibacter sp. dw_328]|uniref:hypothetical protein n=1 Tax=Luteibacter sp. dw_328 TaxID=2719796 RepID=UPI001BD2E777|nr:hypothetical protein [Luteibacter sp. dw_328]
MATARRTSVAGNVGIGATSRVTEFERPILQCSSRPAITAVGAAVNKGESSDERAYVYLEESASHKIRWITPIPVRPGWYQNRASHCVAAGDSIYALVQSDTNAVPVLSQTLISIATLNQASGHMQTNDIVKVSDLKGAHTVFVYDGAENFLFQDGKIVVTGELATKGDAADTRTPFKTSVPVAISNSRKRRES